jgi:hypothetical protein
MSRVLGRHSQKLTEVEPDPRRRERMLSAFLKSAEFRAEMAAEARRETSAGHGNALMYGDLVNCYVRWRAGRASAQELAGIRKLSPAHAAMSIAELRNVVGDAGRLRVATGVHPKRAAMLKEEAERLGLLVDVEPP